MKRLFAVVVFVLFNVAVVAEVPASHLTGGSNPATSVPYYGATPLTDAQKESRLLQYISACIDQRRPNVANPLSSTSSGSSVLGTSLY